MPKIEIDCCGGNEEYQRQCLKERCPIYSSAKADVEARFPWLPTGFGNAYGNPKHKDILKEVRRNS